MGVIRGFNFSFFDIGADNDIFNTFSYILKYFTLSVKKNQRVVATPHNQRMLDNQLFLMLLF
ncbi:hypothetical protein TISLANDTSLP1_00860 [Thermodesulfovibrio yellowstonii]|uniref:Uncharacterized protein n=1 Tax=Thermodesulfovibrio yellowstonii TaxID=28262 RepID=A0A9W6GEJ4_9BACT|nr:hypothetical protein TISLANDTSLP1_00860 [Thermodesulfovibrio islandicus]